MEPGVKATGPALAPAQAFDIANVAKRLSEGSGGYEIVHASPGIEVGVYVLVAPEPDRQQPHEDDEVYVVLEGNGVLEIEGERVELREGHAVFVPAGAEHQFVGYEHLIVLVIFERRGRERVSAMTSITTAFEPVAQSPSALGELFDREREAVIGQALLGIGRLHGSHYQGDETERRLERLYDHVVVAATRRDLGPIVAYAQGLADERYTGGHALAELQAAFNALEVALWETLVDDLPPNQVATALTLVSSIFGVAKDTLACSYVAAATRTRTQALDIESLAAGAGSS